MGYFDKTPNIITPAGVIGEIGKNYKMVGFILRNEGVGWYALGDVSHPVASHTPMNLMSVTNDGNNIIATFAFTAKNIVSFWCIPDETFAPMGLLFGPSVSITQATINVTQLSKTIGAYVYYDGATWQVLGGTGNISIGGFSGGVLTLNHDTMLDNYDISLTSRSGIYIPVAESVGDAFTQVKFMDWGGTLKSTPDTNMKFFITRSQQSKQINPNNIVSPTGNIWCGGIFEV